MRDLEEAVRSALADGFDDVVFTRVRFGDPPWPYDDVLMVDAFYRPTERPDDVRGFLGANRLVRRVLTDHDTDHDMDGVFPVLSFVRVDDVGRT